MKKAITFLSASLIALVSLFFAFAKLTLKFAAGIPEATQEATRAGAAEGGKLNVNFFEFIGDFASNNPKATVGSVISSILVVLAIICVATVFVTALISIIKKDNAILETMLSKWLTIAAFALVGISLLINLIWPNLPAGTANVFTFGSIIGLGSIVFLSVTAVASVLSFVFKD